MARVEVLIMCFNGRWSENVSCYEVLGSFFWGGLEECFAVTIKHGDSWEVFHWMSTKKKHGLAHVSFTTNHDQMEVRD